MYLLKNCINNRVIISKALEWDSAFAVTRKQNTAVARPKNKTDRVQPNNTLNHLLYLGQFILFQIIYLG